MARAGFVLFLVVVFYVWIEPAWLLDWMDVSRYWARWVFVALITAGTIAVGAATDGRRWGMWLWLLIMAALVWFLITVIGSNGFENGRYIGVVFALSLLLFIHALECLYLLLSLNLRKGER